jgi:hypothetical protein
MSRLCPFACLLAALWLAGCTNIDGTAAVESALGDLRLVTDSLLQRKTEAELELMRESAAAGRILREEAGRFERAKCHAGLPALRAWAERSAENRAAVKADCGLEVTPAEARLGAP